MYPSSSRQTPAVSLEFFPPKGLSAERALMTGAHVLRRFAPAFQTVTFGADGSAIDGSLDWPARLQSLNEVPTAAHLTLCQFDSPSEFLDHADALWQQGIKHLVVLRGDTNSASQPLPFADVAHAVAALKSQHNYEISVAAYPEGHPMAANLRSDLAVLRDKQEAGADRAITQFFFDNATYFRFLDSARLAGVKMEIVPGIMPINNIWRVAGFARKCGADMPQSLLDRFSALGDDPEAHTELAREVVCDQVRELREQGVDAIHIYTLNRVDLTADTIRAFQNVDQIETTTNHEKPRLALAS